MSVARKKRVIVDTNCWISFLIGRRLGKLVTLLSDERIELVLCSELLEELLEVTQRPKFTRYFPLEEVESLLEFLRLRCSFFTPTENIKLCRDIEDDYLLNLAHVAKAHYLVTGDKDLLVLKRIECCKIVDVKEFEEVFREK